MKGIFKSGSFWFGTFAVLLLVGGVWTSHAVLVLVAS